MYMTKWGGQRSWKRYQMMTESLRSFIRDKERYRDPSMNDAIDDWQNDLDWFREKYKISQNSNFYISEKVCVSVFAPG